MKRHASSHMVARALSAINLCLLRARTGRQADLLDPHLRRDAGLPPRSPSSGSPSTGAW